MKDIVFFKEFIFFIVLFYTIYMILYQITSYRIKAIMNDDIKIVHVKWILFIPLWVFVIFLIINLYNYAN